MPTIKSWNIWHLKNGHLLPNIKSSSKESHDKDQGLSLNCKHSVLSDVFHVQSIPINSTNNTRRSNLGFESLECVQRNGRIKRLVKLAVVELTGTDCVKRHLFYLLDYISRPSEKLRFVKKKKKKKSLETKWWELV